MAAIKGKDTKPEMIVRKYLFSRGLRYRLHVKKLPGSPDIVLPKYKTVIFVDGCFWHGHEGCRHYRLPKTNTGKTGGNWDSAPEVTGTLFDDVANLDKNFGIFTPAG